MLIGGSIVLAVLPVAITALVLGKAATDQSGHALEMQAQRQLISIRDAKKDQIETLFTRIENQITTLAQSQTVLTVLQSRFRLKDYNERPPENLDNMRAELTALYKRIYQTPYDTLNPGGGFDVSAIVKQLKPMAVALQHNFASHKDYSLETSASYNAPTSRSSYSTQHETFHPVLDDYVNRFGFLDLFVVDTDGLVVYSRNKWMEYGASLVDGPMANLAIGRVFKQTARTRLYSTTFQATPST